MNCRTDMVPVKLSPFLFAPWAGILVWDSCVRRILRNASTDLAFLQVQSTTKMIVATTEIKTEITEVQKSGFLTNVLSSCTCGCATLVVPKLDSFPPRLCLGKSVCL